VPPATFRQGAISLLFEPGSRAVETLFFAAYLSQLWPAPLIVLVTPEQRADLETLTRQIPLDPDVVTEMELGVEAVLAAAAANQSALLIFAAEPAAPRAKKGVQTGWEPLLLASPLPVLLYR
jgi:hypothetical protein